MEYREGEVAELAGGGVEEGAEEGAEGGEGGEDVEEAGEEAEGLLHLEPGLSQPDVSVRLRTARRTP